MRRGHRIVVDFILACLDIDDDRFAGISFLHFGPNLALVQFLSALHGFVDRKASVWHRIYSFLWRPKGIQDDNRMITESRTKRMSIVPGVQTRPLSGG